MIFRPELIRLILAGKKTETRRRVKNGETECHYQPGKTYAVQPGRGKPGVARIEVLYVKRERLRDLNKFDAIAEGFAGDPLWTGERVGPVEQFFLYWSRLYGELPVDEDQEVWVIGFEVVS